MPLCSEISKISSNTGTLLSMSSYFQQERQASPEEKELPCRMNLHDADCASIDYIVYMSIVNDYEE